MPTTEERIKQAREQAALLLKQKLEQDAIRDEQKRLADVAAQESGD
jgi:hypothetical protein